MSRVLRPLPSGHARASTQAATSYFWERRRDGLAELPNADAVRRRARAVRLETLRHLDTHLTEATASLRRAGCHVHFAADAAAACAIITDICRAAGADRVVKSKSMATEEIQLNTALGQAGIEAVETDLGEYIVQRAGEMPSHIVGPAIHKSRAEIQALFAAEAGRELSDSTEALAAFARERLRHEFLTAPVGITGANFLVAETGTLVLVTNEGNGRLCSSLPPVHIAVVGIEKLVPKLADLGPLLAILPRSATGQRLTTFVHLVTGPRRPGDIAGPEEMHVVFLDNGRTDILGSEFEEVLACIRCGACLNVCPVYRQTGGHAYGSTYSGPIGAVLSPLLWGLDDFGHLPHASSLCGACFEECPVGIHLHEHLLRLRRREVDEGRVPRLERAAFRLLGATFSRHQRFRRSLVLAQRLQKLVAGGKRRSPRLPGPLAGWTQGREFPRIAETTFRQRWQTLALELTLDGEGGACGCGAEAGGCAAQADDRSGQADDRVAGPDDRGGQAGDERG